MVVFCSKCNFYGVRWENMWNDDGLRTIPDVADSFSLLCGLTVRYIQIRVSPGERLPFTPSRIQAQAEQAVEQFSVLYAST